MTRDGTETHRSLLWSFWDTTRLVADAGRWRAVEVAALQLLSSGCLAAQVLVARAALTPLLQAHSAAGFAHALPMLALFASIGATATVVSTIGASAREVLGELVTWHVLARLIRATTSLPMLAFEDSAFHDRLRRAQTQGTARAFAAVNGLLGALGGLIASVGIVGGLATLQPLLLPPLILALVPLWIASYRNTKQSYDFYVRMTSNERQRIYLQHLLLDRGPAKEIRAFQLAAFLSARFDQLYRERVEALVSLARRRMLRSLAGVLGASLTSALSFGIVALLFATGRMSLATAGASLFGLYQLSSQLRSFQMGLAGVYESAFFLRDYSTFVLPEHDSSTSTTASGPTVSLPRLDGLRLDNVSFTYPGSGSAALDGVSMHIAAGETIALVGTNGSGKTTLAKLIAGLYPPSGGKILWNEINLTEVPSEAVHEQVAVVFQDFERYLLTAAENIGVGRHSRLEDVEAIVQAARRSGAHEVVEHLPHGYETLLGKEWSGGLDLSLGQWQRLALARAFFRDAPLVIFDEPTAALDALAESSLYGQIRELLGGRTVILISHRFSSVQAADRIYVLSDGHITECGSHSELMRHRGTYARLFALQASLLGPDAIPA